MKTTTQKDPRVTFGEVVRKHRLALGLSQEELAGRAQIHRNYLGSVERGERNVAILNMVRIARTLGIPLHQLLKEVGI